jgi:hypothetical protein
MRVMITDRAPYRQLHKSIRLGKLKSNIAEGIADNAQKITQ